MAYIDKAFFDSYTTTRIPEDEFLTLAARASDVIDILTMYRIGGDEGLFFLPSFSQNKIKMATAAQIETMFEQGGLDTVTGSGASSDMDSASIGKFSYSKGGTGDDSDGMQTINGIPVSPLACGYLWPTGLLYGGEGCHGQGNT